MILAGALGTYLPWLVLSGDRDQTFIWYLLPTIPFLCLALGFFAALAWERMATRVAAGVYARAGRRQLRVLPAAAGRPADLTRCVAARTSCSATAPGRPLPDDTTSSGEPPPGWCWI